jgi:hypothetical protein
MRTCQFSRGDRLSAAARTLWRARNAVDVYSIVQPNESLLLPLTFDAKRRRPREQCSSGAIRIYANAKGGAQKNPSAVVAFQ